MYIYIYKYYLLYVYIYIYRYYIPSWHGFYHGGQLGQQCTFAHGREELQKARNLFQLGRAEVEGGLLSLIGI